MDEEEIEEYKECDAMQCGVGVCNRSDNDGNDVLSRGRNGLMSKEQYGLDRYQQQDNHCWLRNPWL